ncbi:MAG: vWA domain-containing protein, partial [Myxococcota bacterium]
MRWWLGTTLLAASVGCDTGEPIEVDTGALTFEVCAEVQETANRVPVNLLLTIDRSGSMADGQPPKWDAMTSALQSFVDTPDAQQLRVGLRVWPADDGCNTDECDAEVCSQPQVPVGSLESEDQRTALLDEVAAGTPEGDTPMSAALHGARTWAQRVQGEVPEEQVAIALLTDGIPNGCDESIDNISSIASDALDDGTPTYVLGIEGSRVEDV